MQQSDHFRRTAGPLIGALRLSPGDKLIVAIWNPQTLIGPVTHRDTVAGTAPAHSRCVPDITSVGTFEPGRNQNIDIKGSCLGTSAPFTDSNSINLYIQDSSSSPRAWSACNGGAVDDLVTCTVTSWTRNEIVLSGFGGAYGEDDFVMNPGDQVIVAVWNSRTGVGPGARVGTVGSG